MEPSSPYRQAWRAAAAAALAALAVLCIMRDIDPGVPFADIWSARLAALGFFFFCLGMSLRRDAAKILCFCLLAVCAALAVGEGYLASMAEEEQRQLQAAMVPEFARELREQKNLDDDAAPGHGSWKNPETEQELALGYVLTDPEEAYAVFAASGTAAPANAVTPSQAMRSDSQLGYRPNTGGKPIIAVRKSGKNILYNVVYTLTREGWRTTPLHPEAGEALVFLGDSFTFGEGLNDSDTFTYRVSELLGNKYQIFNFAYSGWGPHQLLRIIETGMLDDVAKKYKKIHVFYFSIPAHRLRVAGKSPWDQDGPCYAVADDGGAEYMGSFRQCQPAGESASRLFTHYSEARRMDKLHTAVVRQMAKLLAAKYQAPLTVMEMAEQKAYLQDVRKDGVDFLCVAPGRSNDYIILGDGHPNVLGARVIAEDIAAYVQSLP